MSSTQETRQEQITLSQSLAVMKNTIRLSMSTIAFQRSLFPSSFFTSKVYCGVNLEILRAGESKDNINPDSVKMHEWLEKGAFVALELGYVSAIIFNILDAHPDDDRSTILEQYAFDIEENERMSLGNGSASTLSKNNKPVKLTVGRAKTRGEIQSMTQKVLKTLIMITSSLPPVPAVRWLSVSITYNDFAPQGYQAPQFEYHDLQQEPGFRTAPLIIPCGQVSTGLQKISLRYFQVDFDEIGRMNESTQQCGDDVLSVASGRTDDTMHKWTREKIHLLSQAEQIIKRARLEGRNEETALRTSEVGKQMPPSMLTELLSAAQVHE